MGKLQKLTTLNLGGDDGRDFGLTESFQKLDRLLLRGGDVKSHKMAIRIRVLIILSDH